MLSAGLLVAGVAFLCAALILGYFVSRAGSLWAIDAEASALRGNAVPLALFFTLSGRSMPLLFLGTLAIVLTVVTKTGWEVAVAIVAAQLLSQAGAETLKRIFRRTRPDAWIVHQELGFSFPSGHATTAVVFYGSWAVFVMLQPLPSDVKIVLAATVLLWALGISWSRMALGAHYPIDIIGGTLFGLAWASALWALLFRFYRFPTG